MKKIICLIIPAVLVLCLSHCGNKKDAVENLFSEAEALETDIINNVAAISQCKSNYEKILVEAPQSKYAPIACYKLGKLNEVFGHYTEAIDYYRKLITLFPHHEFCCDAYLNMAQIYFYHLENIENAKDTYEQILFYFPENKIKLKALVQLGQIYSREEEWEKAAQYYQQVVEEFPENEIAADVYFRLGDIWQNGIDDETKAAEIFTYLVNNYPGSSWCTYARERLAVLNEGE